MSVWKLYEKLLIFAFLISPSSIESILLQNLTLKGHEQVTSDIKNETVFHHKMEHLAVRQKYSSFNSLLSVSSGDEPLSPA